MQMSKRKKLLAKGKEVFAKIILFFLYRGMKVLYCYDDRMREEIDSWPIGQTIVLAASERGPRLCIRRVSWGIARVRQIPNADVMIGFKSLDGAFLVLSGQIGTTKAYAQHRFRVEGDIAQVMSMARCIDLTEAYLFPEFMTRKILKKVPEKRLGSLKVYVHAMVGM